MDQFNASLMRLMRLKQKLEGMYCDPNQSFEDTK